MAFYLLQGIPVRQLDDNGAPMANARLYAWAAGTTTLQNVYTDRTGGTQLPNPVVADVEGFYPQIWVSGDSYDLQARKSDDATVLWDALDVQSAEAIADALFTRLGSQTIAGDGSGMVGYGGPTLNYVAGTIGYKLNQMIHLTDFKVGSAFVDQTGATDTKPFFQAAHDYADSLIGTAAYNDLGVQIWVPTGKYLLASAVTMTSGGVSFVGPYGRGATLIGTGAMFDIGDHTDTTRIRDNALVNLTLFNTDGANSAKGVVLHRTIGAKIVNCNIDNFDVGIQTYRASTSRIEGGRLDNANRTTTATAGLLMEGLDETVTTGEAYTPGGGIHITDWEISGSSGTVDTTTGILLKSCDGFYMENTHIVGCEREFVTEPAGTPENHVIVDVQQTNGYLDQPSIFASVPYCFVIGGTVKKTITMADASTQQSIYRGIRVASTEIRPSNYGRHGVFIAVTDADTWGTTATQKLEDINIIGGAVRQAQLQGIQCNGAALGAYVEPRGLTINGTHFDGNNSIGGAGFGCDINVALESGQILNTTHADPGSSGHAYIISAITSDAGATDSANPSVRVVGADFSRVTIPPLTKDVNITPSEVGANTQELDVLTYGSGKLVRRQFKKTTTNAVATPIWEYTIPTNDIAGGSVQIFGRDASGARYVHYSWTFSVQRAGGAAGFLGASPVAGLANKDATTPAPTLTLVGSVLTLTATGVAATTIDWTGDVNVTFAG